MIPFMPVPRDHERILPPWYQPVPKGQWLSLALNVHMVLFNVFMLALLDIAWMALWASLSTATCIFLLAHILHWRQRFGPYW